MLLSILNAIMLIILLTLALIIEYPIILIIGTIILIYAIVKREE